MCVHEVFADSNSLAKMVAALTVPAVHVVYTLLAAI